MELERIKVSDIDNDVFSKARPRGTAAIIIEDAIAAGKKKEAESRDETDPKAKLAELKRLLVEQQQGQALLEAKIGELERLL